jgi:hypothetical protein
LIGVDNLKRLLPGVFDDPEGIKNTGSEVDPDKQMHLPGLDEEADGELGGEFLHLEVESEVTGFGVFGQAVVEVLVEFLEVDNWVMVVEDEAGVDSGLQDLQFLGIALGVEGEICEDFVVGEEGFVGHWGWLDIID